MFNQVTTGSLSGKAGEKAYEQFKVNGQYVNMPEKGLVGNSFYDEYLEKASIEYLRRAVKSKQPLFMSINFLKVHPPITPPDLIHKSPGKSKFSDSIVENDTRMGKILEKVLALGLDKNSYVFWTTVNGAWQDVDPDSGCTPFPGTKGTVREGGVRVSSIAWGAKITPGSKNHDILGGLDFMATFASLAGVKLPEKDREGQPMMFEAFDMSPVLFGTGKSERKSWSYFTENELTPGAVRVGNRNAVFNLRGDDEQATGGLAVDSKLGWKGASK